MFSLLKTATNYIRNQVCDKDDEDSRGDSGDDGKAENLLYGFVVIFSIIITEKGLGPLGDTVEDRCGHQSHVGDDAIGSDAGISGEPENQEIEDHGGHTGGNLTHKSRYTQLAGPAETSKRRKLQTETDGVLFGKKWIQQIPIPTMGEKAVAKAAPGIPIFSGNIRT